MELFENTATRKRNQPDDTRALCGVLYYLEVLRALDKLLKENVHRFCQNRMGKKKRGQLRIPFIIVIIAIFVFQGGNKKPNSVAKLVNYRIFLKK